jgi:hypothetical protein
MDSDTLRNLLPDLTSDNSEKREQARMALFALDEHAVTLLSNEFFAGVSEPLGVAILDITADIGGPEALALLRNVYHFEDRHEAWRQTAARGLLQNRDSLDREEKDELLRFSSEV